MALDVTTSSPRSPSTDRAVSDFLLSEVLASLPPDLVEFLVETSVLDAFDAELCVAVTGVETRPRSSTA